MGHLRWMSIAVVVTVAVMAVMAGLVVGSGAAPANQWGAGAALNVLVAAWFTVGIRAGRNRAAAVLFVGILAVTLGVGVAFMPSMATLQAIAETIAIIGLSLIFSLALGLWITQISHLTEQRQILLTELHATRDELAAVSQDAGVASERERLAREIHDTIA